jgi:hypothetical protein
LIGSFLFSLSFTSLFSIFSLSFSLFFLNSPSLLTSLSHPPLRSAGLYAIGYIKCYTTVVTEWSTADGNDYYPNNPDTLKWVQGRVWWIGIGAAAGVVTGIVKALTDMDEYPSFIVEVRECHVDPWMSLRVTGLCLVSEMAGLSMGPEAGGGEREREGGRGR